MKHRGVVEEGQVGHVFGLLELWRVHLLDKLLLEGDLETKVWNKWVSVSQSVTSFPRAVTMVTWSPLVAVISPARYPSSASGIQQFFLES